jgi:hypothetical protein
MKKPEFGEKPEFDSAGRKIAKWANAVPDAIWIIVAAVITFLLSWAAMTSDILRRWFE